MLLPKPGIIKLPDATAPAALGIGACNTGNACNNQSCDVNSGDDGGGGCSWDLAGTVITVAATVVIGIAPVPPLPF